MNFSSVYRNGKAALVAVSSVTYSFDKEFSYLLIGRQSDIAKIGMRVVVPFGSGNRKRIGIILGIEEIQNIENVKLKPIISIVDSEPILNSEQLDMIYWLRDNTFCTFYDAFKVLIPSGMNISIREKYSLSSSFDEENLSPDEKNVLGFLKNAKTKKEFDAILKSNYDDEKGKVIQSLIDKSIILQKNEYKQNTSESFVKMIRLTDAYIYNRNSFKLTIKQQNILRFLEKNDSAAVKEICYVCNVTSAVVKNLVKNGVAEEFEYEVSRIPKNKNADTVTVDDIALNDEQQSVFEKVAECINTVKPDCFLLHGITGSGKTSVFKKLIDHTIKNNRQALLLIPEISLTPQMVAQFQECFGDSVAVLHSNLSLGRRLEEYKNICAGKAKIVIGTRSAIFAPLDNIGIIIMDEEGERSYKSDSSPRYNTVDVAKRRCRTHNAVLLLASATPSIESYYYAQRKIYKLLELKKRYHNSPLPQVHMVDMTEERENGNLSEFSEVLVQEINFNLEHNEQSILLLNRRGYHTIVSCAKCGKPIYCPNCSVPMTYHKSNESIMCHYCGHSEENPQVCPECGSSSLKKTGFGTQRLEDELEKLFPTARILRMDADTTFSRYAYEKKFKAFGDGEYDIMVGTQMISKGLDFPNVTLVGVISADKSLFSGDFRSYERTFSLITQVVGRGGRGDKNGRAYLQTFIPDHYVLNLASMQDYQSFYKEEIAMRKALLFPPVCDICVIGFNGEMEQKVKAAALKFYEDLNVIMLDEKPKFPLRVLMPVMCSYGKISGKYRYRLIIKCKNTSDFRKFMSYAVKKICNQKEFSRITIYADINGDIGV